MNLQMSDIDSDEPLIHYSRLLFCHTVNVKSIYTFFIISNLFILISRNKPHPTELYVGITDTQWPIVYTPEYNIGFLGLEKLHPFDAGKWGKVYEFLKGTIHVKFFVECGVVNYSILYNFFLYIHVQMYLIIQFLLCDDDNCRRKH